MAVHADSADTILTVKRRHEVSLLAIPGVMEARVGPVFKNGRRTGEIGIVVYVDRKLPPEQIDPSGLVPVYLDGYRVDVQPIGQKKLSTDWRTEVQLYGERIWRHKLIVAMLAVGALAFSLLVVFGPLGPRVSFGPLIPRVSCNAWVRADRDRHIEVLKDVKQRHRDSLWAIPGVHGLGVGFVRREGRRTDEVGIVVVFDSVLPPEQIDPDNLLPTTIEGCMVNVQFDHLVPRETKVEAGSR